jgi:hypothetical protein
MDKNIISKESTEKVDNKKMNEFVNNKVAEDEVEQDLSKRDKFFDRVSQKIKGLVSNKFTKEKPAEEINKSVGVGKIPLNWKKLIPFSPLLIIILFAVYIQFFSKGKTGGVNVATTPTPTYAPLQKFKPSIYANDPVVIGLEETVNVLDREMSTTPLTESTLTQPVLDFNIGF